MCVDVCDPIPVFTDALKIFVAVGAVVPAGRVYGWLTVVVAAVQVVFAAQLWLGAAGMVTAEVDSDRLPVVNVVDVAVIFQPVPDPVASVTVKACVLSVVWSTPDNVALKATDVGAL